MALIAIDLQRYFVHMAYDGSQYRGWQRQPKVLSVQEVLEEAMHTVLKHKVHCAGCGRTDAQVHADQYFFHFDFDKDLSNDFVFVMNKVLPDDLSIYEVKSMPMGAHAQMDAVDRTYDYFIHTLKDPFLARYSSLYLVDLSHLVEMKKAASLIPDYRNFIAFCKSPEKHNHTFCEISFSEVSTNEYGMIRFRISANRFLRGMIRALSHELIQVGIGEIELHQFETRLKSKDPMPNIQLAYPQGLHLSKIKYPYLERDVKGGTTSFLQF